MEPIHDIRTPEPSDPALPSARQLIRRVAWILALLAAGAILLTMLPGLGSIPEHLAGADPAWVVAALLAEIASTAAFCFAFHGAYERRTSRRASTSTSLAVQGMNILLPAGGTGGLAVGSVILDRAGLPRAFAASRTVALFLLTSLATFVAIVAAGVGVATGLLPGDAALVATLGPAIAALLAIAAVIVLPRVLGTPGDRPRGRVRRMLWNLRVYLCDGVASSIALLRARDRLVIWGALAYFAFDVVAMAASFKALGAAGLPVGLLVLAYTLGHGGATIPLPGSAEGGLIGAFVLYGVPLSTATAAVLAYRVVHAGVPIALGMIGLADMRRLLREPGAVRRAPGKPSSPSPVRCAPAT